MQAPFIEGPPSAAPPPTIDPATVCSTNSLPGYRVLRPLGVVRGITVRSRNIGADIGAGLKSLAGGEIKLMTTLCESARKQAFERMLEHAAERGANGVLAVRYDSNAIAPGITEVVAYGMAVTDGGVPASSGGGEDLGMQEGCICTSNELPGYTVHRSLGVVQGLTVRTRNVVASLGAAFKSMAGGEIKTFTKMCEDARQQAHSRMVAAAVERGADGIIAMRYNTNEVAQGITEVLAYGTAVTSVAGAGGDDASAAGIPLSLMTTASSIPGFQAQHSLGVVQGITVRSSNVVRNIGASLKAVVGGEIHTWSQLCQESRQRAFDRMVEQASQRGAKGIVAMRYDCNQIVDGMVEVIAYGTAVSDAPPSNAEAAAAEAGVPHACVSTDLEIPGGRAERTLGTVRGISVRTRNLIWKIGAAAKSIVGGEIRNYTQMCEQAREEAYARMLQDAARLGATGITGMRYESNDPEKGVIEVVAYGTAVWDGSRPLPAAEGAQGAALDVTATCTSNELLGRGVQRSLGIVRGVTVRSRNVFANFGAGLQAAFVGGEIGTWTRLCEATRQQALERLLQEAAELGAQGVVGMRYETNEIAEGIVEVLAYGTAVA